MCVVAKKCLSICAMSHLRHVMSNVQCVACRTFARFSVDSTQDFRPFVLANSVRAFVSSHVCVLPQLQMYVSTGLFCGNAGSNDMRCHKATNNAYEPASMPSLAHARLKRISSHYSTFPPHACKNLPAFAFFNVRKCF